MLFFGREMQSVPIQATQKGLSSNGAEPGQRWIEAQTPHVCKTALFGIGSGGRGYMMAKLERDQSRRRYLADFGRPKEWRIGSFRESRQTPPPARTPTLQFSSYWQLQFKAEK
jgi:hypothetical protein